MKRYVVTNQSSGLTHAMYDTIAEAIASAVKLQDEGSRVLIIDAQGSGVVMTHGPEHSAVITHHWPIHSSLA